MRCLLFVILASFFIVGTCPAQDKYRILPANADCSGLIDLGPKDTVWGPTNAPSGYGSAMEISDDMNSLYAFEKEHNTVWYRFRIPEDGRLTLDIIPVNTKDDYDFILYKFSGKNFCSEVAKKTLKPVRACISRNDPALGSRTGMSSAATDEFIHSGPGPSYCRALDTKKGEVYVIVLDNVYAGGSGHTLKLHFAKAKKPVVTEQITHQEQTPTVDLSSLSVTIVDKETHELVRGTARIYVKQKKAGAPLFTFDSVTSFSQGLGANSAFVLKIEANGYFDYSREIKTLAQAGNMVFQAELDKIIVGKNVIFENILFFGDESRFLPESDPSLESLTATMKKNPNLKIEIQGHVNCPASWDDCQTKRMLEYNLSLSLNRAKAVYEFLTEEGIAPERMAYKGFGATRMLFPDARSEDKMKQNRRVEIAIISN